MHRTLVEEQRWLAEREFLHALNFCMLLPGPEAMQLATYAGWKLHGWRGALAAGTLFVLPGAIVVLALTILYALFGQVAVVVALFFGIKAAVLAIVLEALLRIARRALTRRHEWWIAAAAFIALYVFGAPFPLVITVAALAGFASTRDAVPQAPHAADSQWRHAVRSAGIWLALWLLPIACLAIAVGVDHTFTQVALFFSKLALVTFGGAYAVLAYMAQQAVAAYGWLSPHEMIDGLGLAETTPGPLILVTEFVGFLAGYRAGGMGAGLVTAAITLWVTFIPCFLWIMAGARYVDRLQHNPRLAGALAAITAAVVGVILNLSLWFALHVTFGTVRRAHFGWLRPWLPVIATVDLASVALSAIAVFALLRLDLGIVRTLVLCAALGAALQWWL